MKKILLTMLVVTMTFTAVFAQNIIYVSEYGRSWNDGLTAATPMNNIQDAIDLAIDNGSMEVRISGDFEVYSARDQLISIEDASDLTISGGWNSDFSAKEGVSTLDGNGMVNHVVYMANCNNLTLMGLVLTGGETEDLDSIYISEKDLVHQNVGGGLYATNITECEIYCEITDNHSSHNGGGMYLIYSDNNKLNGEITGNTAVKYGGGLSLYYSDNNEINCEISGNSAEQRGGGIYLEYSDSTVIYEDISDNYADVQGGGIAIWYSEYNFVSGDIYGNSAGSGGGVWTIYSHYNTFFGDITDNFSEYAGGGVLLNISDRNTLSGEITRNSSISGAGVFITSSDNNTFSGDIKDNIGTGKGGGLFIGAYSYTNVISGKIFHNFAYTGGALHIEQIVHATKITGDIFGNTAELSGGGIYFGFNNKPGDHDYSSATISGNVPDDTYDGDYK